MPRSPTLEPQPFPYRHRRIALLRKLLLPSLAIAAIAALTLLPAPRVQAHPTVPASQDSVTLTAGDPAPDFTLQSSDGGKVHLSGDRVVAQRRKC